MRNNRKFIVLFTIFIISGCLGTIGRKYFQSYILWTANESQIEKWEASTQPLQNDKTVKEYLNQVFKGQKKKVGELINFPTIVIPGLRGAWSLENGKLAFGVDWVPQGLTMSKTQFFVSAYDKNHKLNSLVYVIDKKTGRYEKSLILDNKAHVGGLAYDRKYRRLWISTDTSKHARLSVISQNTIDQYQAKSYKKNIKTSKKMDIMWLTNTSSISIDGEGRKLSIAKYDPKRLGAIVTLTLNSKGYLNKEEINHNFQKENDGEDTIITDEYGILRDKKLTIGLKRMQGLSISNGFLFISQSNGVLNSRVGVYKYGEKTETGGIPALNLEKLDELSIPAGVEQMTDDFSENRVWMVFESGARPYRANNLKIMDRIFSINYNYK